MVEFEAAKIDAGLPIFNYAVGYDLTNSEPLMYEKYPGSINDVSQLQFMVEKVKGYGYKNIGFILDRGYFSKENLRFMDNNGFIIMVKGCKEFISEQVRKQPLKMIGKIRLLNSEYTEKQFTRLCIQQTQRKDMSIFIIVLRRLQGNGQDWKKVFRKCRVI